MLKSVKFTQIDVQMGEFPPYLHFMCENEQKTVVFARYLCVFATFCAILCAFR